MISIKIRKISLRVSLANNYVVNGMLRVKDCFIYKLSSDLMEGFYE
jgi:hypothetical protein